MSTDKEIPKILWRCELRMRNENLEVVFDGYQVTGVTPKGYWIAHFNRGLLKRWVPTDCNNRFAFVEREAALKSYFYLKRRHIKILKSGLSLANKTLAKIQGMIESKSYENTVVEELLIW